MGNEIKYKDTDLYDIFFNFTYFKFSKNIAIQSNNSNGNHERLLLSVIQHNSIAFVIALDALGTSVHGRLCLRFIESYSSCRAIIS